VSTTQGLRRWLGMPFIALGVAMIIVDATIVNVAIPSIIRDLRISAPTADGIHGRKMSRPSQR
jgi:hypothetical protein